MNERRAQDDTSRLARAVLRDQLEVIRESLIRRGQSEADADEVVGTVLAELREGDTALLETLREKALN